LWHPSDRSSHPDLNPASFPHLGVISMIDLYSSPNIGVFEVSQSPVPMLPTPPTQPNENNKMKRVPGHAKPQEGLEGFVIPKS
jgi:hypothetical protein